MAESTSPILPHHVQLLPDARALDRARVSRDPRFDGRFFVAVTSTGIYCRPVCPAPTPKQANVRYFPTAAAAAEAGFRPCLRCRPEAAPGTPAWAGTSAVVRRALRLIQEGALDESSVQQFAERVGIGPRHLHRLFVQHVGASPNTVAQTRRLHFAKRLVDETSLTMTEISLAAGYRSLRRFNDAFRTAYGRAPREIRRGAADRRRSAKAAGNTVTTDGRTGRGTKEPSQPSLNGAADTDTVVGESAVVLRLAYRPPYDWASLCDFLAARAVPGVERVDASGYARTIALPGQGAAALPGAGAVAPRDAGAVALPDAGAVALPGARALALPGAATIRVRPLPDRNELELTVTGAAPAALFQVSMTARRMFDLAADPALTARALSADPALREHLHRRPGLRIPGIWDPLECAVRAVLGQQVSVAAARTLAARLVARAGRPSGLAAEGLTHLFPSAADLAGADLSGLGVTGARIAAIQTLARAVLDGKLDFTAPAEEVIATLEGLPGFGAWTAHYIALRALGEPDALPAADIVLRRMAAAGERPLSTKELEKHAEAWRPWRSYAVLHLWQAAADASHRPPSPSSRNRARDATHEGVAP